MFLGAEVTITVPNSKIIPIWEHKCIEYIAAMNLQRASEVLYVMNSQCERKLGVETIGANFDEIENRFQASIVAKDMPSNRAIAGFVM